MSAEECQTGDGMYVTGAKYVARQRPRAPQLRSSTALCLRFFLSILALQAKVALLSLKAVAYDLGQRPNHLAVL